MTGIGIGEPCANCDALLTGQWCHACGQKRIVHADRRLGALMSEAAREVTSLDGRFLRTVGALLFRPGVLGRDWLAGRRARWMSPMALFLLANLLYFLAPGLTDFNLPLSDHVNGRLLVTMLSETRQLTESERRRLRSIGGQAHSSWTSPMLERRVAKRNELAKKQTGAGYTLQDYAREYDAQSGNVGKALIAVHVPILALALMCVFRNRRLYFAEHLVIALHTFTFLLLFVELVLLPGAMLMQALAVAKAGIPTWIKIGSASILVAYLMRTLRIAYAAKWWHATLGVSLWIVSLGIANLWIYRTLQFLVTFAVT